MMTDDRATWLRAQLDDEQMALHCKEREWRPDGPGSCEVYVRREDGSHRTIARCGNGYDDDFDNSRHIARQDPTRELAEVDAKRQRLATIEQLLADDPEDQTALHLLALDLLPYADLPGYRQEWAPAA